MAKALAPCVFYTSPLGSFDGRNGGSPQSLHKEVVKLRIRQESIDERPFDLEAEQDRVIEDYKRGVITAVCSYPLALLDSV